MNASTKIAAGLMALYGLIALVGGVIGYASKGSMISLIAGGAAGVILVACGAAVLKKPILALVIGMLATLALLGKFIPDLVRSFDSPTISILALVMTAGGVVVLVAAVVALGQRGIFRAGS